MGTASTKCGRCNQNNRKYRMYQVKVHHSDIPDGFYCKHCWGVMNA